MPKQKFLTTKWRSSAPKTAAKSPTQHLAMHSAESPDWGTPILLRHFAARVMAPAAKGAAIDLDYASSAYWQRWWDEAERPLVFLDGSKGRDVLVEADRRAAAQRFAWGPRIGSGFLNAPGLNDGRMVQNCWGVFEQDHREERLDSGFWVGFSIEQLGSLQNVGERNPLTCAPDDLITTIVPSRRVHYVLPPEQLIAITQKKQKKRERKSKQWLAEQRLIERLRNREDDAPVDGGAPTHLSYMSILWARDRAVRSSQMKAAREFLKEQQAAEKSVLHKFEAIGPLELR
jgi:hypothetical protein